MSHANPYATHLQPQGYPTPTGMPVQLAPVQGALSGAAVSGGGAAATAEATRVRWGRVVLVVAGIAMLGFAAWSSFGTPTRTSTKDAAVTGGGASETLAPLGGGEADLARSAAAEGRAADAPTGADAIAAKLAEAKAPAADGGGAASAVDALTGAPAGSTAAAATTAPVTGGGAGATATGELPYTGAETWIAGILGVAVLILGICIQINAVRIGMMAMLYRRGILLRPIDCARLAHQRGLLSGVSRVRVLLSNGLHRLLAEPEGSDFVRVRRA